MQKYQITFYQKTDGTKPAKDFILSLDKKMIAKTLRTIKILSENGTDLREPYSKPLGDGIFELRVKVGSNISRVFYFFFVDKEIVLTSGFVKKTKKTPPAEIERAKRYRADFFEQRRNRRE